MGSGIGELAVGAADWWAASGVCQPDKRWAIRLESIRIQHCHHKSPSECGFGHPIPDDKLNDDDDD